MSGTGSTGTGGEIVKSFKIGNTTVEINNAVSSHKPEQIQEAIEQFAKLRWKLIREIFERDPDHALFRGKR